MTQQEYEQYLKDHPCKGICEFYNRKDCTRNPITEGCVDPVVEEYMKQETISVQFSVEELDEILEYQKNSGAETVQEAIMIAVSAKQ